MDKDEALYAVARVLLVLAVAMFAATLMLGGVSCSAAYSTSGSMTIGQQR